MHPQSFHKPHVRKLWVFLYPPNKAREGKIALHLLRRIRKILSDQDLNFGEQLRQIHEYLLGEKNKLGSDHNFGQMGIDIEIEASVGPGGGQSAHRFKI